jgi:hypothetical protein
MQLTVHHIIHIIVHHIMHITTYITKHVFYGSSSAYLRMQSVQKARRELTHAIAARKSA